MATVHRLTSTERLSKPRSGGGGSKRGVSLERDVLQRLRETGEAKRVDSATEELFDECLRRILHETSMSVADLANRSECGAVNIYRYLRNDRLPNASIITQIAAAVPQVPHAEPALLAARDRSVAARRRQAAEGRVASAQQKEAARRLLAEVRQGIAYPRDDMAMPAQLDQAAIKAIDVAVSGRDNFVAQAIQLLGALPAPSERRAEILVAYRQRSPFDGHPEEEIWLKRLTRVIDSGWNVKHLVKVEDDPYQPVRLFRTMIRLSGLAGSYETKYLPDETKQGIELYDLVLVPSVAALILLPTTSDPVHDVGLKLTDKDHVFELEKQFRLLWSDPRPRAQPLIEAFLDDNQVEFERRLLATAGDPEVCIFKSGLPTVTQPEWWHEEAASTPWAKWVRKKGLDVDAMALVRRRRLRGLKDTMSGRVEQGWPQRAACPRSAIESLLRQGLYAHDDPAQKAGYILSDTERLDYLDRLIQFLKEVPAERFQLALIEPEVQSGNGPAEHVDESDYGWVVGAQSIFMETTRETRDGKPVDLAFIVSEPNLALGFRGAFDEIWDSIELTDKENAALISWLQTQAEWFRAKLAAADR